MSLNSEQLFRTVFEEGPVGMALVERDYQLFKVNSRLCQMLGYTDHELTQLKFTDITHPEDIDIDVKLAEQVFEAKIPYYNIDKRCIKKNGEILWINLTASVIRGEEGEILYGLGMIKDITEPRRAEEVLRRYERIVSASSDLMTFVDTEYTYQAVNAAYLKAFWKTKEEVIGQSVAELLGKKVFEARIKWRLDQCLSGKHVNYQTWLDLPELGRRYLDVHYDPFRDTAGSVSGIVVNIRDITERKRAQETLAEQAIRDTLTNLYNRRYFNQRINEEMARAERNQHTMAILLCDLDHFKAVNDTRGHQVGDDILKAVAKSIRESTRGTDLVFRWGGDEFVVILAKTAREGILISAERIRKGINKISQQTDINLDMSVGVAIYPEHGGNRDDLIRLADRALYIAKKSGDLLHIGDEEYQLDVHSIKIVFQPIVDIRTGEILGYEALSCDPKGELSILELFKKYQAVGQFNELKCICFKSQLKAAEKAGLKRVFINVNFKVLRHVGLVSKPLGIDVILEISELEAMDDINDHLKIVKEWREQGYKFAIDDFGAGFLSLPFIAEIVPDHIKVDRSTILKAVSSEEFRSFLKDLLQGLKNYSKEGIIAEGIETTMELEMVKSIGIYIVQGFLLGKPQEMKSQGSV